MITWASTTGYSVAGSCESSCTAVTVSLTGTTTTAGTTCSSTVLGNTFSFTSCYDGATNSFGTTDCPTFNCKVFKNSYYFEYIYKLKSFFLFYFFM